LWEKTKDVGDWAKRRLWGKNKEGRVEGGEKTSSLKGRSDQDGNWKKRSILLKKPGAL